MLYGSGVQGQGRFLAGGSGASGQREIDPAAGAAHQGDHHHGYDGHDPELRTGFRAGGTGQVVYPGQKHAGELRRILHGFRSNEQSGGRISHDLLPGGRSELAHDDDENGGGSPHRDRLHESNGILGPGCQHQIHRLRGGLEPDGRTDRVGVRHSGHPRDHLLRVGA